MVGPSTAQATNGAVARRSSPLDDVLATLRVAEATARRVPWSEIEAYLLSNDAQPEQVKASRGAYLYYCSRLPASVVNHERGYDIAEIAAIEVWLDAAAESVNPAADGRSSLAKRDRICGAMIWCEALGLDRANYGRKEELRITGMLKSLRDWEECGRVYFKTYGRQRAYQRIGTSAAS